LRSFFCCCVITGQKLPTISLCLLDKNTTMDNPEELQRKLSAPETQRILSELLQDYAEMDRLIKELVPHVRSAYATEEECRAKGFSEHFFEMSTRNNKATCLGKASEEIKKFCDKNCEQIIKRSFPLKKYLCQLCNEESWQKCSSCEQVHYCCRKCQELDWKSHKKFCRQNVRDRYALEL
jgi:hypothetical protein